MSLRSRSGLNHILGLVGNVRHHDRNVKTGDKNDPTASKNSQGVSEPQNSLQDYSFLQIKLTSQLNFLGERRDGC